MTSGAWVPQRLREQGIPSTHTELASELETDLIVSSRSSGSYLLLQPGLTPLANANLLSSHIQLAARTSFHTHPPHHSPTAGAFWMLLITGQARSASGLCPRSCPCLQGSPPWPHGRFLLIILFSASVSSSQRDFPDRSIPKELPLITPSSSLFHHAPGIYFYLELSHLSICLLV